MGKRKQVSLINISTVHDNYKIMYYYYHPLNKL